MNNIDKQILNLKEEIRSLEKKKKELSLMKENERLAVLLHQKRCSWNHADGCGWYYEIKDGVHDWNGYAHKDYLKKANEILSKLSYEEAIKAIESGLS